MNRFVRWSKDKIWHLGIGRSTLCKKWIPSKIECKRLQEADLGPRPKGRFCAQCDAEAKRTRERLMKVLGSPHFPEVEEPTRDE